MTKQIIIGFTTEGTTDVRFLESIIQRTFEAEAFNCAGQIEILPVQYIDKKGGDFIDVVKNYAQQARERGIMILCIHCDADDKTDTSTFNYKINPSFDAVRCIQGDNICKILVAIVPVRMTEAWMLSDTELLRDEIGTNKNDKDIGIDKLPEIYSDPKETIENAIRVARKELTKRRRRDLTIGELYSPIGQKISLNNLGKLPSYEKFRNAVKDALSKC